MSEYKNLYIYVSDALRRDFFPDNLPGTTMPAVAPGPHTAQSFPSFLSGTKPEEHGVNKFPKSCKVPTLLDLDQLGYDVSFWDHPKDVTYKVFRFPPRKPLEDLEEPFIFVHRDTSTHAPYCDPTTGEVISWKEEEFSDEKKEDMLNAGRIFQNISGPEYINMMAEGEVDYREHYKRATEKAVSHFLEDMKTLKENGLYDDTLRIFTSDHGDAFPDDNRGVLAHGHEVPEVMNVAINFFEHDIEVSERFLNPEGEFLLINIPWLFMEDWEDVRKNELHLKGLEESEREELEEKVKERLKNLGYLDPEEEDEWKTFKG